MNELSLGSAFIITEQTVEDPIVEMTAHGRETLPAISGFAVLTATVPVVLKLDACIFRDTGGNFSIGISFEKGLSPATHFVLLSMNLMMNLRLRCLKFGERKCLDGEGRKGKN